MIKDNLKEPEAPLTLEAGRIIPNLRRLLKTARRLGWPVIFACDSFMKEDFIFHSRLAVHALRGTPGVAVIEELGPEPGDLVLEKRRFSAFFKTDLDQTLRTLKVNLVAVTGLSTAWCVLMTAVDAISHDFGSVILEDCCCAHKAEIHRAVVDLYRHHVLNPLFEVVNSQIFLERFKTGA